MRSKLETEEINSINVNEEIKPTYPFAWLLILICSSQEIHFRIMEIRD